MLSKRKAVSALFLLFLGTCLLSRLDARKIVVVQDQTRTLIVLEVVDGNTLRYGTLDYTDPPSGTTEVTGEPKFANTVSHAHILKDTGCSYDEATFVAIIDYNILYALAQCGDTKRAFTRTLVYKNLFFHTPREPLIHFEYSPQVQHEGHTMVFLNPGYGGYLTYPVDNNVTGVHFTYLYNLHTSDTHPITYKAKDQNTAKDLIFDHIFTYLDKGGSVRMTAYVFQPDKTLPQDIHHLDVKKAPLTFRGDIRLSDSKCTNFKYMESSGKPIFEACFEDLPPHPTGAIVWDTSMLNPDGTEAFNQFIEKDNLCLDNHNEKKYSECVASLKKKKIFLIVMFNIAGLEFLIILITLVTFVLCIFHRRRKNRRRRARTKAENDKKKKKKAVDDKKNKGKKKDKASAASSTAGGSAAPSSTPGSKDKSSKNLKNKK